MTEKGPIMTGDRFSEHYSDLLEGVYDCVDRIVLNAYFTRGHIPGGFRNWWRRLFGDDENLDNTHLMRFAGRFSRRVRGWAKKRGIPVIDCRAGVRKHEKALDYLPTDPEAEGFFVIFAAKAPGVVWNAERSKSGALNLVKKKPMPYVNHYSFHILDREWGHLTVKICPHPPFKAQIMLNGHEYVARQARRLGIGFVKEGNCFTKVSDAAGLHQVADTLRSPSAVGRLKQVCERWIYRCLGFALDFADQERTGFRYDLSVYQLEASRNLLFSWGSDLERVFQSVIDRTRSSLDIPTLRTLFGRKTRPYRRIRSKSCRCDVAVETPEYNLTIFKLRFGRLGLKMYSKGERVLRIEATAHNAQALRCGRVVEKFPDLVGALHDMVLRFLATLRGIDVAWVEDKTLEHLPIASQVGRSRIAGLQIEQPRIRAVFQAVTALAAQPRGFTAGQVAEHVACTLDQPYHSRQAAYDLKKLRGKDLVVRIGKSKRYEPSEQGLRVLVGVLTLRDKVLQPLLANSCNLKVGRKPLNRHFLDPHYETLQRGMRELFRALNFVPQ